MKILQLIIPFLLIFVFAGCNQLDKQAVSGDLEQSQSSVNVQQTPNTVAQRNISPAQSIKYTGDSVKPTILTSDFFKLKLTVPKGVFAGETHSGIGFTFDSEGQIDSNGVYQIASPFPMGTMDATPGKTINDFVAKQKSYQHKDFKINEFTQDGKVITDYSYLSESCGMIYVGKDDVFDHTYAVEHNGYLLEFSGHECQNMKEVIETLDFQE